MSSFGTSQQPDSTRSDDAKRLGRAIVFVHQHDHKIHEPLLRAKVDVLLLTGKAMDLAARLKGHQSIVPLTHGLVHQYASYAGLGGLQLNSIVLPALKRAGLVDYTLTGSGEIHRFEEFIGVSASVTEQAVRLLETLGPTRSDLAFLHSVEIAAIAPLAESQHVEQVIRRGFSEPEAKESLTLAMAIGLNLSAPSAELNEPVIYSPYVWGTKQLSLAKFLASLPPAERDALLGMSEQVLSTPGLHMSKLNAAPEVIRSAQNVGLIQAASVLSSTGAGSTYVFSPIFEAEDNLCSTTEAFHMRKLFVAHILFGHEKAAAGKGNILSPTVLVRALINRGVVGPATNIGTDYYLLEQAGVVAVDASAGDRAFLRLVKPEIAEAGLEWIKRISDPAGDMGLSLSQKPSRFIRPEDSRQLGDVGAANEIVVSAVNELRKEMQRAARRDDPWS